MGQPGRADEAPRDVPAYQSGREFDEELIGQLNALPEFFAAFAFANAKTPGFEADDFLAAAVAAEERAGGSVVVASGDRDSLSARLSDHDPSGSVAPKNERKPEKRDRKLTLTRVSKRGRFGKRVFELQAIFEDELRGDRLTPLVRVKIARASQMVALAEAARGGFMRDGSGNLDDLLRLEREAARACAALGLSVF